MTQIQKTGKKAGLMKRVFSQESGRFLTSKVSSIGVGLAGGAAATSTLLGNGETFTQKLGDAIIGIPRGIANTIITYIHAPEYIRETNDALSYLREQGPNVANELARGGRYLEAGVSQSQRAISDLEKAADYLMPGGNQTFDPQNAFYSLRDGVGQLETAIHSINTGKAQLQETAGPTIDALKDLDLNPFFQALYNLADNVAPDEIAQTVAIGAGCLLAGVVTSQYIGGYWGRRGRPGILARTIQKSGLKRYKDYFTKHPEKIAGERALEIIKENLVQNPSELEKLAERAGYRIVKREGRED